jgi:hypothetical protein
MPLNDEETISLFILSRDGFLHYRHNSCFILGYCLTPMATAPYPPVNVGSNSVKDYYCIGYYGGIYLGEHNYIDHMFLQSCYQAIQVQGGTGHTSLINRALVQASPYVLYSGTSNNYYLQIAQLAIEDAISGYWCSPIDHVYDPNNAIHGSLTAHRVLQGTGPVTGALTVNGATNLTITTY